MKKKKTSVWKLNNCWEYCRAGISHEPKEEGGKEERRFEQGVYMVPVNEEPILDSHDGGIWASKVKYKDIRNTQKKSFI